MNKQYGLVVAFSLGLALMVGAANGAEWYVDAVKAVGSGDGRSLETAFHTIQEAVDAASAGDTVLVAGGVYGDEPQEGVSCTYGGKTFMQLVRVVVTRRLTICALDPDDKPVILGSHGDAEHVSAGWEGKSDGIYYRTTSVACVLVREGGAGTVFKNLVFRDGNAHQSAATNNEAAGGIFYQSPRANAGDFMAIDCTFDHCCGRGGGAIHGGTAIRCTFTRNFSAELGAAAYQTVAYNCLFRDNATEEAGRANRQAALDCILVNCTLVNNGKAFGVKTTGNTPGYGVYVNTLVYGNVGYGADSADSNGSATACVGDAALGETAAISRQDANVMTRLCVCPHLGDIRPVAGGLLDGTGDEAAARAALASCVPEDEIERTFDGKATLAPGTSWPIGVRLPAAEVKSGAFKVLNGAFSVDGKDVLVTPTYIQTADWPIGMTFARASTSTARFLYVNFAGLLAGYRGARSTFWQMMPPKKDVNGADTPIIDVDMGCYEREMYVDGDYVGEMANGEQATPYKTIQAAVDALPTDGKFTLVHVAGGHYKDGDPVVDATGHRARVSVPDGKRAVFVADEGPEKTFIEGSPDATTGGCGEQAVRCLGIGNGVVCAFAGFTFAEGYTQSLTSWSDTTVGGAVWTSSAGVQFHDCRFVGNGGHVAAVSKGWYVRCVFTNNVSHMQGVATDAILDSCLLADNGGTTSGQWSTPFRNGILAYNCTVCETRPAAGVLLCNADARLVNCAVRHSGRVAASTQGGSLVGNVYAVTADGSTQKPNLREDPDFLCPAHGRYRLATTSPARGAGIVFDATGKVKSMDLIKYVHLDLEGNVPLADDGSLNAGCYKTIDRRTPVFVSPEGDDAADGETEGTAYGTLQRAVDAAAACTCRAREVVALPGTYATGGRCHVGKVYGNANFSPTILSRVVVPGGITLTSRDGAATAVIVGKAADETDPSRDSSGCGDTAVRCAFLEDGAVLRGFTLTGGYACADMLNYHDDVYGGAALGRSVVRTSVEECVLTGNHSPCGGAAANVTLRRCRVEGNNGLHFGGAVADCSLYDCALSENCGDPVCYVFSEVVNCTFFGNWNADTSGQRRQTRLFAVGKSGSRIVNVLGYDCRPAAQVGMESVSFQNCVFDSGFMVASHDPSLPFENVSTNLANAVLAAHYENGRARSGSAPTVDCGSSSGSSDSLDLAGDERVKNGTIDIGAYEYGWYAEFSQSIGRRFAVQETAGDVRAEDGRAVLRDGATLTGLSKVPVGCPLLCTLTLDGAGTVSVYLNGKLIGTLTQSGTMAFVSETSSDVLSFSYAGTGSASVASICRDGGLLMIVR